MKNSLINKYIYLIPLILLSGCYSQKVTPIYSLNSFFAGSLISYRDPKISQKYLITIVQYKGNLRMELIDLDRKKIIFLPGINSNKGNPISVSMSSNANKIAFIEEENGENYLFIYFRKNGFLRQINFDSKDVPMKLSLSASGKTLAIQVLRDGKTKIDIIQLDNYF